MHCTCIWHVVAYRYVDRTNIQAGQSIQYASTINRQIVFEPSWTSTPLNLWLPISKSLPLVSHLKWLLYCCDGPNSIESTGDLTIHLNPLQRTPKGYLVLFRLGECRASAYTRTPKWPFCRPTKRVEWKSYQTSIVKKAVSWKIKKLLQFRRVPFLLHRLSAG